MVVDTGRTRRSDQHRNALFFEGREMKWEAEVWFLWWRLPVSRWTFSSLEDGKKSVDIILSGVRPILRRFCRIEWVKK